MMSCHRLPAGSNSGDEVKIHRDGVKKAEEEASSEADRPGDISEPEQISYV